MRIVLDTNLLVSGVISLGLPRQLLAVAQADAFELCTLGEHEGIPIVTARQAVARLEARGKA